MDTTRDARPRKRRYGTDSIVASYRVRRATRDRVDSLFPAGQRSEFIDNAIQRGLDEYEGKVGEGDQPIAHRLRVIASEAAQIGDLLREFADRIEAGKL